MYSRLLSKVSLWVTMLRKERLGIINIGRVR
ncbi:hypothetical protein OESDEN_15260 [Oesophagostomum dentatum]|uniref:Uncharacterized protein n=1 Tax=Oesophagostomum dentatum TaxID=61180 RepID=A0A0B1SJC6_OESDE|nr:hypothetical protein OESDEN_15260 [Oesophagostomum dentatum]